MRRSVLFAGVLFSTLVGCGEAAAPPTPPTPPTRADEPDEPDEADAGEPEAPRERQRAPAARPPSAGSHGAAWRPSAKALRLARLLGDPATREATLPLLESLPKGERIDVLRAGLRLEDPEQARFAAGMLEWTWLDAWESARAVELLTAWAYARPDDMDFGEYRSYLGSSELGPLLAGALEAPQVALEQNYVGQVHRQVRTEHVPLLVDLSRSENEPFAAAATGTLGNILSYTDGPRERVGRAIAERDPQAADEGPLPRGAIPAELARSLRVVLFGDVGHERSAGSFRDWALRWFASIRPTAGDAAFLLDLHERLSPAEEDGDPIPAVAVLRALSFLDDPESLRALRGASEHHPSLLNALLARRGDAPAAKATWDAFETDDLAMAFALEGDPRRAGLALSRGLLSTDYRRTLTTLATLEEADAYRALYGLQWDPRAFTVVEAAARDSAVSPAALGWIAYRVPGCRTRALVGALLARLEQQPGSLSAFAEAVAYEHDEGPSFEGDVALRQLGLAELAFPSRLRALLRSRSGEEQPDRRVALSALLRLGDADSGPRLVEFVRDAAATEERLVRLSRSRHPAVAAYLTGLADAGDEDAWQALASYHGLPAELAADVLDTASSNPDLLATVRAAIREGRALDALAAALEALPDEVFVRIGDVGREPRAVAYLERLRVRRELDHYAWATGELAVMGFEDARREVEEAVRAGRYRWVDNWRAEVLLAGVRDPDFWLDEAESNCCRLVVAGQVFEHGFGQEYADLTYHSNGRGQTPADALRRWWHDTGKVAWSWLARAHLPVPR